MAAGHVMIKKTYAYNALHAKLDEFLAHGLYGLRQIQAYGKEQACAEPEYVH